MSFALDHFRTFARYNAWANQRLYDACGRLPEAEYMKPRPAFFKSLHGTLNHILVGDRVWMSRFTNRPQHGIKSLDQTLYGDFAGLWVARQAEDAQIIDYADGLSDSDLARVIGFKTMNGTPQRGVVGPLLAHFFNHQTHHRGQAHDQLSQTAVPPPELDLLFYQRTLPA